MLKLITMIGALIASVALTAILLPASGYPGKAGPESPDQLVSEVVANELKAQEVDHSLWRYRQMESSDETREEFDVVETPMGSIHRLLKRNGQPLTADESRKEDARIRQLLASPETIEKRHKQEEKDGKQEQDLLRMLPTAFEYRYAGNKNGMTQLDFSPRASFRPRRHEGEVFHHMDGTILIDPRQKRLVEISGKLLSDVKFGGGILGHLNKGGTFIVNQKDVGSGHWELTRLFVNIDGRILFFKTISEHQNEEDMDFTPVQPNITLQHAAELLRDGKASAPRPSLRSSFK